MERLKILDGLRVIAILMVMGYHYCYYFNGSLYDLNLPKEFFKYGYLGVQLFFIISGFVITLTLTRSESITNFFKRRWIRLFPGMVICSFLTFLLINLLDYENFFPESKKLINLIISNTFISPAIINPLFDVETNFIDPPYWSLWVEIQFYVIIGLVYFINKKKFVRNFVILSIILSTLFFISNEQQFFPEKLTWFLRVVLGIFNFSQHALWFVFGVLIYTLYFEAKERFVFLILGVLSLLQWYFMNFELYYLIFIVFCTLVFYSFLYNQKLLNILTNSRIQQIGVASYAIYLIHQNLGILVIAKYAEIFGTYSFILPIIITIGFCYLGILIYTIGEKRIIEILKRKIL